MWGNLSNLESDIMNRSILNIGNFVSINSNRGFRVEKFSNNVLFKLI